MVRIVLAPSPNNVVLLRVGDRELEARKCLIFLLLPPRPMDFERMCLVPVSVPLAEDPSESDIVDRVHPVSDVSSEISSILIIIEFIVEVLFLFGEIVSFRGSVSVGGFVGF